jgi:VanZ family protein
VSLDRPQYRALAVALALLILAVSMIPGSGTPDTGHADKLLHTAGYAVLAWLGARALPATSRIDAAGVLVAVVLFGAGVELLQPIVGRHTSLLDAIANLVGATAGLVCWHVRATSTADPLAD